MSAGANTNNAANDGAKSARYLLLMPLLLALLALLAYYALPFVEQSQRGATTISELTAARDHNELGIPTNGILLLLIAPWLALALSVWQLFTPQLGRAIAAMLALCGLLMLLYFAVLGLEAYRSDSGLGQQWLAATASGFWLLFGCAWLLLLQVAWPRPLASPEYRLSRMLANQESIIAMALVLLLFGIGLSNSRFLATRNILDILQGNAYIAVAAIGMTMIIVTGNIDISVGSLVGLLAVLSGRLAVAELPVLLAWLLPVLLAMLIAAGIGALVAYARIPSIVVTLGMLSILRGVLILWTSGQRVTGMPEAFFLAQQRPFGLPMPVLVMLLLTLLAALWMRYSPRGRALYAVGGNAEAARLSGLSQARVVMLAFVLNGMFTGIASVLYASQLRVIQATPPPALELSIITAAVVGGVSILGGKGTVIGAMLAAILLNAIRSSMIFINISPFWIQAVQGLLILATVLADLQRRQAQSSWQRLTRLWRRAKPRQLGG